MLSEKDWQEVEDYTDKKLDEAGVKEGQRKRVVRKWIKSAMDDGKVDVAIMLNVYLNRKEW